MKAKKNNYFLLFIIAALICIYIGVMVATDPGDVFAMKDATLTIESTDTITFVGTIYNRSDSLYSNIDFTIQVLDEKNTVIADSFIHAKTIAGYSLWDFTTSVSRVGASNLRSKKMVCKVMKTEPRGSTTGLQVTFGCR